MEGKTNEITFENFNLKFTLLINKRRDNLWNYKPINRPI